MFGWVEIVFGDGSSDELSRLLRKPLAAGAPIRLSGTLSGNLATGDLVWIRPLVAARGPIVVSGTGPVGPAGLALILLADHVELDGNSAAAPARHPLLAALAALRLGTLAARRFSAADEPIALLREIGHIHDGPPPTRAERRAWNAVAELPRGEALDFAALIPTDTEGA